jgi:hypothetical protein
MLEIVAGAMSGIGKSCRNNVSFRELIFDPYYMADITPACKSEAVHNDVRQQDICGQQPAGG